MRLSEVLSRAPSNAPQQVEGFLGSRKVGWGRHRAIRVGRVALNFRCHTCEDIRTFMSGEELSCLVTGDSTVSIDATLRCSVCTGPPMEVWFLIASDDDLYGPAPIVQLERYAENRRQGSVASAEGFEDLLDRAKIARDCGLGAGAMVYLRKIFEDITAQVAKTAGIPTVSSSGRRVPFRELLDAVNKAHHIIPQGFADSGYMLFSELSEVVHGAASEEEALQKYLPCRELVMGVLENVNRNHQIASAIVALGWDAGNIESISRESLPNVQDR